MSPHTRSHRSHSHSHGNNPPASTGNETANALSASVLPVGTTTPGAPIAHSLATGPSSGEAPSTIPKPAGTGAAAASAEGKNKVIVVFKKETPAGEIDAAVKDVESQGGKITHRYDAALLGFSAEMPDVSVSSLNSHPHVDYVEADGEVSIYAKNLLSGGK